MVVGSRCVFCVWLCFAVCVLWLCFGVERLFSYHTCKKVEFGPAKMANFSALITKNASLNAPNFKGCPELLSSVELGHFLTFWLVANWGALGMEKKCVIFYLGRVPSFFFHLKSLYFRT